MRLRLPLLAALIALPAAGHGATLTTLASFDRSTYGAYPYGQLITDAQGNLFGTTSAGGPGGYGTAYELVHGTGGYSLTTLASFNAANGSSPLAGLVADANGNLFGTTYAAGPGSSGTIFELVKGTSGYSLTTLAAFNGSNGAQPYGELLLDAQGDLFGTTRFGGAYRDGTVFELAKNGASYTLTTLASFSGGNGANPIGGLVEDARGNLFGTTSKGGNLNDGTVFELVRGTSGYSLTTLAAFNGSNGRTPFAGLVADGQGNLFGTTQFGGSSDAGTVFEMVYGSSGYSLTTLASFNYINGEFPVAPLIVDANGNLFGTAQNIAFELAKGANGYGSLTQLASLGSQPFGGLVSDAEGDLFGTTQYGGSGNAGRIFEITGAGYMPQVASVPEPASAALLAAGLIGLPLLRRRR